VVLAWLTSIPFASLFFSSRESGVKDKVPWKKVFEL
jgi:hypothetical protein